MRGETVTIQKQMLPAIGLGTWLLNGSTCEYIVAEALQMGYGLIDSAQDYGNERWVGRGIKESGVHRREIFLVSKLSPGNFRYDDAIRTTRKSLDKLQTDYLDVLLLHWPNPAVPIGSTMEALNKLREEGMIQHIGLSNFPPRLVEEASVHARIFCNEVEYHPYLIRRSLYQYAREREYLLLAYSPLAKGEISNDPVLSRIGKVHGKTPAQITLRWLVQQGMVPIPKASSLGHLRENLSVFDFHLSPGQMKEIESLDQNRHLDPVSDLADD
jgi:diketogulonate reductase-like aldo/keto reductase